MSFTAGIVPVAPMRKEPSHRSEMVSQLLFGEVATILEAYGDFTRIRCMYDQYEGWCQSAQLVGVEADAISENNALLCAGWLNQVDCNGTVLQVPMGTPLDLFVQGEAHIGRFHCSYKGNTWDAARASFDVATIQQVVMPFLNTGYLWGGRSVFGIDCSGLTQQVFRFFHKKLPRDAYQQVTSGETVNFLQEAVCGDLAFFDNEEGKIIHVGIMLGNNTIIHSSGRVRIDTIDHAGIINSDTGERTHHLRIIKRYA